MLNRTLSENVRSYDWSDWLAGIMRSVISGGASGVLSGLLAMGIAPDKFTLVAGHGLFQTLLMMGGMFLGNGVVGMMVFLKTHSGPTVETTTVNVPPAQPTINPHGPITPWPEEMK